VRIYDLNDTPVDGNIGYVEMLERDVAKEVRRQTKDRYASPAAALILGGGLVVAWTIYALTALGVIA